MVSSGSACSKGEKSHVVQVWPIDEKDKDSVIRVSFGRENTREEVRVASEFIAEGIKSLKFKGV